MPWKENRTMDLRVQLIQDYENGENISALAEVYEVSRKTIYKCLARHAGEGMAGLADRSRTPHTWSHGFADNLVHIIDRASALAGGHASCGSNSPQCWVPSSPVEQSNRSTTRLSMIFRSSLEESMTWHTSQTCIVLATVDSSVAGDKKPAKALKAKRQYAMADSGRS
jgi:Helix-turn-helix domain